MRMKGDFIEFLKKYKLNSILFVNFLKLTLLIFVVFIGVSFFVYKNAVNILNDELVTANSNNVKRMGDLADTLFREIEYIASTISIDKNVQTYILSNSPGDIIGGIEDRVKEKIFSYNGINKYIDSIYIYSETSGHICSTDGDSEISEFSDVNWLTEYKKEMQENFRVFPRAISNRYPYVLTFIKNVENFKANGAIIININIQEFGNTFDSIKNGSQDFYIVDNDNTVIYSGEQEQLLKKIAADSVLGKLLINNKDSFIINSLDNLTASAVKSDFYNWRYVSATSLTNYNERLSNTRNVLLLFAVLLLLLGVALSAWLALSTFMPFQKIIEIFDETNGLQRIENLKDNELKYVTTKIISIIDNNKELKNELDKRLTLYNNAQLVALQSQISPHFLNNTLNIINLMIVDEFGAGHDSSKMIVSLTRLLKFSFEAEEILITIRNEIKYLSIYVELLKQRYKNTFNIEWDIDEDILDYKILKLCIQPIIENAVYHGICPKQQEGTIRVSGHACGRYIEISVWDNGAGISKEIIEEIKNSFCDNILKGKHIGIKNIYQRLKIVFGEDACLDIESIEGEQTTVTLKIPKNS